MEVLIDPSSVLTCCSRRSGFESALAILKKMSRERAKNIFLISHKDELIGRVNNVLRVVKENGFTQYANDVETYEHSR